MKNMTMTMMMIVVLVAAIAGAGERTHSLEPEDYFSIAGITGIALSPDGKTAAWTEMRWDVDADRRKTELWTVDLQSKEPQRLTFDGMGPSGIRFSKDARWIYFSAADADSNSQIWRIFPTGGDATKITSVSDGIDLWDLSADGRKLVYTVSADQTDDEWKDLRDTYSDLEYGHGVTAFSEVHSLDLDTWRTPRGLRREKGNPEPRPQWRRQDRRVDNNFGQ